MTRMQATATITYLFAFSTWSITWRTIALLGFTIGCGLRLTQGEPPTWITVISALCVPPMSIELYLALRLRHRLSKLRAQRRQDHQ